MYKFAYAVEEESSLIFIYNIFYCTKYLSILAVIDYLFSYILLPLPRGLYGKQYIKNYNRGVLLEEIARNGGERPKGAKQQDLRLKSFLKTLLYTNLFVKTISFNIP